MKGDPSQALPMTFSHCLTPFGIGFGYIDHWDFVLNTAGNIRFLYKSDSPWTPTELGGISFRYVIVPGGVAGGQDA